MLLAGEDSQILVFLTSRNLQHRANTALFYFPSARRKLFFRTKEGRVPVGKGAQNNSALSKVTKEKPQRNKPRAAAAGKRGATGKKARSK